MGCGDGEDKELGGEGERRICICTCDSTHDEDFALVDLVGFRHVGGERHSMGRIGVGLTMGVGVSTGCDWKGRRCRK